GAAERLGTLPPSLRGAGRLRIVDELDYDEVADALGTTESAARVRVHPGLAALRKRLSGSQEDPRGPTSPPTAPAPPPPPPPRPPSRMRLGTARPRLALAVLVIAVAAPAVVITTGLVGPE